jgi:predicted transcriptional regulator
MRIHLQVIFVFLFLIHTNSYSQTILNWHTISAISKKDGVQTDSIFVFNVFYYGQSNSEADECSVSIIEIANMSCKNNEGIRVEKPVTYDHKNTMSCKINRNNNHEYLLVTVSKPMEKTIISIDYDRSVMDVIDFEASSAFDFPNMNRIKVNYIPLKSSKGYASKGIDCGKINLRTIVSK